MAHSLFITHAWTGLLFQAMDSFRLKNSISWLFPSTGFEHILNLHNVAHLVLLIIQDPVKLVLVRLAVWLCVGVHTLYNYLTASFIF